MNIFSLLVQSFLVVSSFDKAVLSSEQSTTDNDTEIIEIPKLFDTRTYEDFGDVHTLSDFTKLAVREEVLENFLQTRFKYLAMLRQLLKVYMLTTKFATSNQIKNRSGKLQNIKILSRYDTVLASISENLGLLNNDNEKWIGYNEFYMSTNSFLMNQMIYQLRPMTSDMLVDTTYEANLTARHICEIGTVALFRKIYYAAVEWMEEMRMKYKDILSIYEVCGMMRKVIVQEHNRALDYPECVDDFLCLMNLFTMPVVVTKQPAQVYLNRNTWSNIYFKERKGPGSTGDTGPEAQYLDLCRTPNVQSASMQVNLKCYYEQKRHPYLYVNPVKVEHLSEDPLVFQYYGIVDNKTSRDAIDKIGPNVTIHRLYGHRVEKEEMLRNKTSVRTVSSYFKGHRTFYSLMEMVTGLQITGSSEDMHFVEYTYGRHHNEHLDLLVLQGNETTRSIKAEGERLATILYNLELPTYGGYTPFCEAGVRAYPVKGSAVIWYNMYRNGSVRFNMHHGSCPVLHGRKAALLHAIRYHGNWNRLKCSLNQID